MEKLLEAGGVRALGGCPIRYGVGREEKGEHRSHAVYRDSRGGVGGKLRGAAIGDLVNLRVRFEISQHRDSGADGQRIARERSGLVDGAERRDLAHDVGAAAIGCQRKSSADNFAPGGESVLRSEELLNAA